MNILCLGLNHQTAPIGLREKFAIPDAGMESALRAFRSIEGVQEIVILSTCNRVEFYAAGPGLRPGLEGFDRFLRERAVDLDPLEVVYRIEGEEAVRHLFRVASGLDSMVLGETEIFGQVKKAYGMAADTGHTSRILNKLFQKAFQAAKHVRTHTGINRGSVSVGAAAVELAGKIFGELTGSSVLVLGAGETGERTARSFLSRGVGRLLVCNRSPEKSQSLAGELGGEAVPFEKWEYEIPRLDILITCTAAPEPLLDLPRLRGLMSAREEHPLFVIDLAVPRNVDPAVNAIESVYLYDIDSLEAIAEQSRTARSAELASCDAILDKHVRQFQHWLARGTPPSAGALSAAECAPDYSR